MFKFICFLRLKSEKHIELAQQASLNFVLHVTFNHHSWRFVKHIHFMILSDLSG
jgi:hypothetical protein